MLFHKLNTFLNQGGACFQQNGCFMNRPLSTFSPCGQSDLWPSISPYTFCSEQVEKPTALVTGAGGTIGSAVTKMLIEEGYRVVAVDLYLAGLEELQKKYGQDVVKVQMDISNEAEVEAGCQKINKEIGPISVLVNNAGILSNNKSAGTQPAEWRRVMAANVDGAFYLSRQILPGMKKAGFGRIVMISSMAAKCGGITAGTAYVASKGAMHSLMFSLAREAAPHGVTVNAIAPAYVRTPMVMRDLTASQRAAVEKQILVGRFCEPEEVAHTVQFLINPLSGFITGEIIDQNGGMYMD